jgi:hypothetical protein
MQLCAHFVMCVAQALPVYNNENGGAHFRAGIGIFLEKVLKVSI